ncbi:hypothetical protein [Fluviispira vulneris]|uniref:hypothetical protein n=1 Tax=Fluviispira vulneris TaxID=2763012 RepID=UPI0016469BAA|nr:hypothetical protein [Fluviispira vulneris]
MSNNFIQKYEIIMGKGICFKENGYNVELFIGQTKEVVDSKIGKPERLNNYEHLKNIYGNEWEETFGGSEKAIYSSKYELSISYKNGIVRQISIYPPAKGILFGKDIVNTSKKRIVEHLEKNGHVGIYELNMDFDFPTAGIGFYSPEKIPQDITIKSIKNEGK